MEALIALLPYALLFLICPLMMLFMHRGHGHDHGADERAEPARRLGASNDEVRT